MLEQQPRPQTLNIIIFSCLVAVVIFQMPLIQGSSEVVEAEYVNGANLVAFEEGSSVDQLVETIITEVVEKPKPKPNHNSYATYQVQTGDSLYWIASTYGISVPELIKLNQLKSEVISVGQHLVVPTEQLKYYPAGIYLSHQEVEWLAQMIHAEARGEPYLGQVAVGAVIINRILSPQFPNTLRGVLFQNNAFQPIRNGSFYMAANENARKAALEALNGHDPTEGALYFFNPRQSTDRFMHSRPAQITIGRHRFTN